MRKTPFEIIREINNYKDKNENYYNLIEDLFESSKNQPNDIKYQIYYIMAKEYFYFKEFDKSKEYFFKVFNNRELFIVYNILEDTILHLILCHTTNKKETAYVLYNIFVIKEIDNDLFKKFINVNCEMTNFFSYLYENDELEMASFFLPEDKLQIYIDKLMLSNLYTENIKNNLQKFKDVNVYLYLSLYDKKNIKDYEYKIKMCNDNHSVDIFNIKYDLNQSTKTTNLEDDVIYFLYKNKKYKKLINCLVKDDNFTNNILYFSYFKLDDFTKADFYYKKVIKIIFPVDEIEYLIFLEQDIFILNKISCLNNPIDFLYALECLYSKKRYEILKESTISNIFKFKDINVFKVLISYLLLKDLQVKDVCIFIKEYITNNINIPDFDKDWLYKIVYNSIIDDMKYKREYINLLYLLKDPCLDTIYISLLLKDKDILILYNEFLNCINDEDIKSDLYFTILTLFYEIKEDKQILIKIDITQRSNKQILDLLNISNNKDIVIEAHTRNILTPDILEKAILFYSVKGKLYSFLTNIYFINIKKYLTYNIKVILKKEIDIFKMYGDYKVVEFYNNIIS